MTYSWAPLIIFHRKNDGNAISSSQFHVELIQTFRMHKNTQNMCQQKKLKSERTYVNPLSLFTLLGPFQHDPSS